MLRLERGLQMENDLSISTYIIVENQVMMEIDPLNMEEISFNVY
jgi:hypothetical protein